MFEWEMRANSIIRFPLFFCRKCRHVQIICKTQINIETRARLISFALLGWPYTYQRNIYARLWIGIPEMRNVDLFFMQWKSFFISFFACIFLIGPKPMFVCTYVEVNVNVNFVFRCLLLQFISNYLGCTYFNTVHMLIHGHYTMVNRPRTQVTQFSKSLA